MSASPLDDRRYQADPHGAHPTAESGLHPADPRQNSNINLVIPAPRSYIKSAADTEASWSRPVATTEDSLLVPTALYQPLTYWQTRLIKLLPGDPANRIFCELHIAAITIEEGLGVVTEPQPVKFDALSYSWGHGSRTAFVYCNGILTATPPSMVDVLKFLARSTQCAVDLVRCSMHRSRE